MNLTKNFTLEEMTVHQTEKPSSAVIENLRSLAKVLQGYRDTIFKNKPVVVHSAWRSEKYNKKIGGAINSYHCKGMAVDFHVAGLTKKELFDLMDKHHFGGVEWYLQDFNAVHIDIRGYVTRFDSKNKHLPSHYAQKK